MSKFYMEMAIMTQLQFITALQIFSLFPFVVTVTYDRDIIFILIGGL